MQQEDRRKCITVHGRTKKSQSILWVWRFFRFYVEKLFCVWDKPWSHTTKVVKWESKLILTKSHGLSLESVIKQAAMNQNEFKQPNEGASNIEQKTSSRNQNAKCFRSGNLHNPKLCPFINKFFFFKNKGHTSSLQKKSQVIVTHQAFFQYSFRNYPDWEFGGWFVFYILVTNFKCHATNYWFITITCHTLSIEIDNGASISLLDW